MVISSINTKVLQKLHHFRQISLTSYKDLARAINISTDALEKYINKKEDIPISILLEISKFLDTSIECFFEDSCHDQTSHHYQKETILLDEKSYILKILSYLQRNKNFETYYYLMNEIEVKNCSPECLSMVSSKHKNEYTNAIKQAVSQYDKNNNFKIIVTNSSAEKHYHTIKKTLSSIFKKSSSWKLINSVSDNPKIKDILYIENFDAEKKDCKIANSSSSYQ